MILICHRPLFTLSERGEHRKIVGADHYTIVTHERFAQEVAAVVLEVVWAASSQ